ncbi:hypothetical protein ORI20_01980 [Mycobacterium sp. CVI_P3]|uniref:Uncharacterized protein n=1 Tax=Mycobacterium pinniadriaticum TaxID=2994102 RepID=A0ABT3S6I2_9MYCO|nr:hypothetical protein [Mycobacterium pinniadriaticum]MCX2929027.1 hypothetical protein [Mycobacterium pinniadriaticum]MCX2935106.1 hypothetical protein [Mycobacterium pinniadriaticum]
MPNLQLTHLGGPTTLIDVDGWRILTDPTFDTPGRRYTFGWGTSSPQGPAWPAELVAPVDVALVHPGGVRFGFTGPIRFTMTAGRRTRVDPPAARQTLSDSIAISARFRSRSGGLRAEI